MKKEIIRVMSVGAIIAISWVCGALVYFANVASYYRKREEREKNRQHIRAYIDSLGHSSTSFPSVTKTRKSTRVAKHPGGSDRNQLRQSGENLPRYYNEKPWS